MDPPVWIYAYFTVSGSLVLYRMEAETADEGLEKYRRRGPYD
jgi:hypothetical protein